jgi:hypothetical protein
MWASGWSSRVAAVGILCAALFAAPAADAKVFFSREEALALAFPDADRVDGETFLLEDAQAQRVESLSHAELETLVRVYTGTAARTCSATRSSTSTTAPCPRRS